MCRPPSSASLSIAPGATAGLRTIQSIATENLRDPNLAYSKAELIGGINRVLHQRLLKDVVFSDFSVHDAHQAPFPTTATADKEKPKKAGHGGHSGGHGH